MIDFASKITTFIQDDARAQFVAGSRFEPIFEDCEVVTNHQNQVARELVHAVTNIRL